MQDEIVKSLAALMYYQAPKQEGERKKKSFEALEPEKQGPFYSLAETFLLQIDKLNLELVPSKPVRNEQEIEALLRGKIEVAVGNFFDSIKVWRKDVIPQAELVAQIYQIWSTL